MTLICNFDCLFLPVLITMAKVKVKVLVTQSCLTLHPTDCSPAGPSVHGFPRQEYWSGLPFPSPGDLPDPGIKPRSLAPQADSSCVTREALASEHLFL